MELIDSKETIELIRSQLGIRKVHREQIKRYIAAGLFAPCQGKARSHSIRYLKDDILQAIPEIKNYSARGKTKCTKKPITINASSGCNLFLILMNQCLLNR